MIKTVSFHSENPGPSLLVLGAVHGDEKCGTEGIHRIIPEIESGKIKLERGTVRFVPICNPRAYARNVRFVDSNLNRDMVRTKNPKTYEARLANILCPIIEECDVLLDIHSYHVGGAAFSIINDSAPRYTQFAACLGSSFVISGWTKAYLKSAPKGVERSPTEHIGTTECAFNNGAIDVTLECGQHHDPNAPLVAYNGIFRALAYLEMINAPELLPVETPHAAEMTHVFYSDGQGTFAKNWRHLDLVKAGELLARRGDGSKIEATQDGVIILPRHDAPLGDEWFYLGETRSLAMDSKTNAALRSQTYSP